MPFRFLRKKGTEWNDLFNLVRIRRSSNFTLTLAWFFCREFTILSIYFELRNRNTIGWLELISFTLQFENMVHIPTNSHALALWSSFEVWNILHYMYKFFFRQANHMRKELLTLNSFHSCLINCLSIDVIRLGRRINWWDQQFRVARDVAKTNKKLHNFQQIHIL